MRRIRFSVAMSVDGYIAGPKGENDWIVMDPDLDFGALFSEFDTVLLGRRTFEAINPGKSRRAGGMPGMRTYVFSQTLRPDDFPNVTVVADQAGETLAALKAAPGKDIWLFGGGTLFRSLLDLGMVDTVEIALIPVLLGGGIPLLPHPANQTKLRLAKHQAYEQTGTLLLTYALA